MSARSLVLLAALLVGVAQAQQPAAITGDEELLRSARVWEARGRGDLARAALEKLATTRSDSTVALLELGEFYLRTSEIDRAREILNQLRTRWPASSATRAFETEFRLATSQRLELASLQRMVDLRRGAEARAALNRLLPDGPPEGIFALEYYRILAATPGGREISVQRVRELAARHPDDPRYQVALARILVREDNGKAEGARILRRLAGREDVRTTEVNDLLAQAARTSPGQASGRSQDRASQGSPPAPPPVDPRALAAASEWTLRSQQARDRGQLELAAAHTQAATAFRTGQCEAAIPLVDTLNALGALSDVVPLLETAGRLCPESAWLFETRIRWMMNHDQLDEALALIDARALDTSWTTQRRDALKADGLDRRAQRDIAAGRFAAAEADLRVATTLAPLYPWSRYRLAGLFARKRAAMEGRALMDEGVTRSPADEEMRYARALYLSSIGRVDDAYADVSSIPTERRSEAMTQLLHRLSVTKARQTARRLKEAGDLAGARRSLTEVEPVAVNSFDATRELAYGWINLGDREHALAFLQSYRARADADPDADRAVRTLQAEIAADTGNSAVARDLYAQLVAERPDDIDLRLAYARALSASGQMELARLQYEHVLATEPGPDAEVARSVRESLESLAARKRSFVEAGFESQHKPGDSGISRYDALLVPVTWSFARDYDERIVLHTDFMRVDAGSLPADYDQASLLGTVAAAGPSAARPFTNSAANGVAVGARWLIGQFALDIGSTPLGFELTNIVGGIEWSTQVRSVDVDVGVNRRAVDGSVLSFAGLKDPVTGEAWGGVVETGPYISAGHYGSHHGVSASIRQTSITGTNVRDNDSIRLQASGDWKFLSKPDMRAFAGVQLSYWKYDRNLQDYTFGSGGYYSPQSYTSVSFPIEAQGSSWGWSYRVRVAPSYTSSRRDDDGSSGSVSYSAYGAVEREVLANMVFGAKIDLDRSDYYKPTVLMIYLRHTFGERRTLLEVPPRPPRPYID